MRPGLLLILAIGTIAMGIPIVFMCSKYRIPIWKGIVSTALLTCVGTAGTYLMFYVENGYFNGISFYGAVFFVPVVFVLAARIFKVPYGEIMDFCAVGECIMLALMKIQCFRTGCCVGRLLWVTESGTMIRFPSQMMEMIAALIIFLILFVWSMKNIHRGKLYVWYMLIYGGSRFVLNFCRAAWQEREGTIPMGTIWSVCAIAIGVGFFLIDRKVNKEKS